jgi:hypothetical protein
MKSTFYIMYIIFFLNPSRFYKPPTRLLHADPSNDNNPFNSFLILLIP